MYAPEYVQVSSMTRYPPISSSGVTSNPQQRNASASDTGSQPAGKPAGYWRNYSASRTARAGTSSSDNSSR